MLILANLEWAHGIAASVARTLPTWFTVDDLIGPAEIGLVEAAERYNPTRNDSFRGYAQRRVYGACVSSIRNREYRERSHRPILSPDAYSSPEPSPEEFAERSEASRVWDLVSQLPPCHRAVIESFYRDDVTLSALAPRLGVCESRLSQIHREALSILRTRLAERGITSVNHQLTQPRNAQRLREISSFGD